MALGLTEKRLYKPDLGLNFDPKPADDRYVTNARKYFALRWLGGLFALAAGIAFTPDAGDMRFDTITAEGETYSNVVVFSKSATHVSISHSRGMANIKAKSLDTATQRRLGFLPAEDPAATTPLPVLGGRIDDPRFRELQERYQKNFDDFVGQLNPATLYQILALLAILYLFFCYCCWQICRKTSNRAGLLVWLPGFQMIPLLRAAGMSPWLFLALFVPVVGMIVWIVWCFRICRVRQKSALVGVLMLLPVTNVLAFVYLALSGYGPEADSPYTGGKIKLGFQPSS